MFTSVFLITQHRTKRKVASRSVAVTLLSVVLFTLSRKIILEKARE